jgi:hypothetical protein
MSSTTRLYVGIAFVAAVIGCAQLIPATALAADELHNITYRARVDGVARGAMIAYKIDDTQTNSANPTMLPGRTFETNAVLADPQQAGMQVSIQWPYSANLHCEIQVDGNTVAQADEFIGPKLVPVKDDPNYGVLSCGAPLSNTGANTVNTGPVGGGAPPTDNAAPSGG